MFQDKILFVIVDSSEDTYLMVADEAEVDAYYDKKPHADQMEVATRVGRELTDEEALKLRQLVPDIRGVVAY